MYLDKLRYPVGEVIVVEEVELVVVVTVEEVELTPSSCLLPNDPLHKESLLKFLSTAKLSIKGKRKKNVDINKNKNDHIEQATHSDLHLLQTYRLKPQTYVTTVCFFYPSLIGGDVQQTHVP